MRTKLEILDTIDGLAGELYRSEIQVNAEKGLDRAAPGANLIEAMKPFAETLLDLRDLIVQFTEGEKGEAIKKLILSQLKVQKDNADWRSSIVKALITEIRKAGQAAAGKGTDDAKPGEGDPSGRGRQDSSSQEEGTDP